MPWTDGRVARRAASAARQLERHRLLGWEKWQAGVGEDGGADPRVLGQQALGGVCALAASSGLRLSTFVAVMASAGDVGLSHAGGAMRGGASGGGSSSSSSSSSSVIRGNCVTRALEKMGVHVPLAAAKAMLELCRFGDGAVGDRADHGADEGASLGEVRAALAMEPEFSRAFASDIEEGADARKKPRQLPGMVGPDAEGETRNPIAEFDRRVGAVSRSSAQNGTIRSPLGQASGATNTSKDELLL